MSDEELNRLKIIVTQGVALQVRTLQLLALNRAELARIRKLLLALHINLGVPEDELLKKSEEIYEAERADNMDAIMEIIREFDQPPPEDPWWDKPEKT